MCEIALIPFTVNGQLTATTHYHGDFEMRAVTGVGMRKFHYLGEGLFCVIPADNQPRYYYLMEDNLGSIVHAINGEAASEYDAWYDAWGSPTVTANGIGLFRGYGGHEMLPQYRLINMDGRMYDSTLGRFLSPDNYVQEPDNSQNYNRYSYCLNNPLKYTDPDGELFGLSLISGFIKGIVKFISGHGHWYSPFYDAYKNVANEVKVAWGLVKGTPLQVLSRFTWELPQTFVGYEYTTLVKIPFSDVDKVRYFDGATYIID